MTGEGTSHFTFPQLANELNRINRPKRYLLAIWTCFGFAVGIYASLVALERLHAAETSAWWLGAVLLIVLIPATSVVAFWTLLTIPPSPTGILISENEVRFVSPRRENPGFRWTALRHPITIYDERPLGPTWQNGLPRRIDFVLLSLRLRLRSPLTSEALTALVREAEKNNLRVEGLLDGLSHGGPVGPARVIRLLPPNPNFRKTSG